MEQKEKNKRMSEDTKLTIQVVMAVLIILVGAVLIFLGFYAIPIGEISSSVLTAIGESFAFAGSLLGLDYNYKFKRYKIDKQDDMIRFKKRNEELEDSN